MPFDFNWHDVNYLRGRLEGKRYLRKKKQKSVFIYEDANSTASFFTLLPSVLADESAESELCHHTKTADLMAMSRKHVAEVQA